MPKGATYQVYKGKFVRDYPIHPNIIKQTFSSATTKKLLKRVKTSKRKSTPESAIQRISWKGTPFPRILNTTMTYSKSLTITSVGPLQSVTLSTNDIFDCYPASTTTAQPRFFDTLLGANGTAAPYRNFRVYGSKIELEIYNQINAQSQPNVVPSVYGIGAINSTSSPATTIEEMRERGDYRTATLGLSTGGHDLGKMKRYVTNKYLFGCKDLRDDEDTAGDFETSPERLGQWVISVGPMNDSATSFYICNVKIIYYVQIFNRNDVIDS